MGVEDILEHHGIKGMHWGIRNKSSRVNKAHSGKSAGHALSDDALRKAINRLNMEKQYQSLTSKPKAHTKASNFISGIGSTAVKSALTALVTQQVGLAIKDPKAFSSQGSRILDAAGRHIVKIKH